MLIADCSIPSARFVHLMWDRGSRRDGLDLIYDLS